MTRREQLQEQYEDALFALLMDEVAEAEGERALEENERLKQDPNAAVPESVTKRCRKVIELEFRKKNVRAAGRVSMKIIQRVAVVALVGMLLFTGAFAASETFRVNTLNLVLEVFEDCTAFSFTSGDEIEVQADERYTDFEVGWMPDGFELVEQKGNDHSSWSDYKNATGSVININLSHLSGVGIACIDTEDAEIEYLIINGYDVTLIVKDYIHAVVVIPETAQLFSVLGEGDDITSDDVLRIMENITLSLS